MAKYCGLISQEWHTTISMGGSAEQKNYALYPIIWFPDLESLSRCVASFELVVA